MADLMDSMPRKTRKGYTQICPGLLVRDDQKVEAARFTKAEGAEFSGWIVRSLTGMCHSDPIPTKPEAIQLLLAWE